MFFRKQQSGKQSTQTSTALLESELDFMPDIMILEKIDTPSGTAIDLEIETSEDIELLPFNETPFPDLAPPVETPPAEQGNPLEASVDSPDTLALETPESIPEEELISVEPVETSETAESSITEDAETPELENSSETLEPENISETDVPIAETPEPPETETDVPIAETPDAQETETQETEIPDAPVSTTDSSSEEHDQTDSTDPSETETVENEEVTENEVSDELDPIPELAEDLSEAPEIISGVFTVGENSWVAIDWLYDGGGYSNGQMGIFSLDGLDINSPEFTTLALQRVTSNSGLGYIVIDDALEGAKFASPENLGTYTGLKQMSLQAGGTYAIALIPNGSFEAALSGLSTGAELSPQIQPLFSLITSNPNDQFSSGLLVDVTGDGNTFIMEDLSSKGYSDLDFNDIIFQVRGITGTAVSMDELFDYEIIDLAKDWRTSEVGQAIIEYVMPYVADMEEMPLLEIGEAPTTAQPLIGVIDTGFAQNNPYLDYDKITWGNDFIDNDSDPTWQAGENVTTGNEHGTHVLGEIRELNQNAPIHAIRAVGSGQWAEALVDFVDKARDSGQPNAVVNLSMDLTNSFVDQNTGEGYEFNRYHLTPAEKAAIAYAQEHNVLLVVSSGNNGMNEGQMTSTWGAAAQEFDNILVVGAASPIPALENVEGVETPEGTTTPTTASTWDRSNFSSYGVSLVAEGGTLENPELSTVGDGLGVMAGTSVATAKVTAAAAQVWATNPELSYRQVMGILQSTATDLNWHGWDQETGAGLLNLAAAVQLAKVMTPETTVSVQTPVLPFLPPPMVDDAITPAERPVAALGNPSTIQVIAAPLVQTVTSVVGTGLAALQSLIAFGGMVVSAPVALSAVGVVSLGALGLVGKAYYDLKQAEAEAAANTVAGIWCAANPYAGDCHAGQPGYYRIAATDPLAKPVDTGAFYRPIVFREDSDNWSIAPPTPQRPYYKLTSATCSTYYYDFCYLGRDGYPPSITWIPADGRTVIPKWSDLSQIVQEQIYASGTLSEYLLSAARREPSGFLSGGSLAGPGFGNQLTIFGAGNTAGVVDTENISPYTKDCNWQFKFEKWLCLLDNIGYSPSNIPAATNPNSRPRWTGEEWEFYDDFSGGSNGSGGGNNGSGSGGSNNGGSVGNGGSNGGGNPPPLSNPTPSPSQPPVANNNSLPVPSQPPLPVPNPPPPSKTALTLLAMILLSKLFEGGTAAWGWMISVVERLLKRVNYDLPTLEKLLRWFDKNVLKLEEWLSRVGNDASRLEKLLRSVNYDVSKLEELMRLVGYDVSRLEKLLSIVGDDVSKLEELLSLVGNDASKLEELLNLVGNDISKLERLLSRVYNDVNSLERLLKLSPTRRTHILDGDSTGGGHGPGRGTPNKSEFPSSWSDEQVINNIHDVLIDTNSTWTQVSGRAGDRYTNDGNPVKWQVEGNRYSVRIRIIVQPDGEGIITAYPPDIPRNPPRNP